MIEPGRIAFDLNGDAVGIKLHQAEKASAAIGPMGFDRHLVVGKDLVDFLPLIADADDMARSIFEDMTAQD